MFLVACLPPVDALLAPSQHGASTPLFDQLISARGLSCVHQQRVAIARALVLQPDAILLDEPLSSLDIGLRDDLLDVFRELFRETHTTALYVTHDPHEAEQIADRIVILDGGRAVFSGAWSELPPDHESAFVQRFVKATGRDIIAEELGRT
ncbi:MAG: ABC transporter ATP-binding protein [Deltaproteobacteria bacterium]|nr:ABC transporter ATP-binding protein [Deltaproteobacteria bacterium]